MNTHTRTSRWISILAVALAHIGVCRAEEPAAFRIEMARVGAPPRTLVADALAWHEGAAAPLGREGFAFDGRRWASLRIEPELGDEVAIEFQCRLDALPEKIGGTLISAVHHERPQQIVWAVRTNGDRLELVRLEDPASPTPRYRSVLSRDPIRADEPLRVRVRLDPYEASITVDGGARWTARYFGPLAADVLVLGAEGLAGPVERRLRGELSAITMHAQRYPSLQVETSGGHPVAVVPVASADDRFGRMPVLVETNIQRLQEIWRDVPVAELTDRLRVYRWDAERRATAGEPIPHRVEADPLTGKIALGWVAQERASQAYAIALGTGSESPVVPAEIPLIGAGEPVSVGRSDLPADAGQLLASYPAAADWDLDGDLDLIVGSVIPRRMWLFENTATLGASTPVLAAPRAVYGGKSFQTFDLMQLPDGRIQVLQAAKGRHTLELWRDEAGSGEREIERALTIELQGLPPAANIFDVHLNDADGDGLPDLVLAAWEGTWWWPDGIDPWHQGRGNPKIGYGRGYDDNGRWLGEPPMGSFWFARNRGTLEKPVFEPLRPITAGGEPIRIPTTQAAATLVDVDGDGDRDLLAAVDVDRMLVFEKDGGGPLDLDFALPRNALRDTQASRWSYFDTRFEVVDWDRDGRDDVLMGSNPGLVVLGRLEGGSLLEDSILQTHGANVWSETLVVPTIDDVDGDGAWDILMGDASGFLNLFVNDGEPLRPLFPLRQKLEAGGVLFRPTAGYSGSIQGPDEARWGYLGPAWSDWDGDGIKDVVASDITGLVYWLKNDAQPGEQPRLRAPEPLTIDTWPMKVRWRSRPGIVRIGDAALPSLVMIDEHGYLCLYDRALVQGAAALQPGRRIPDEQGNPIKLDGPSGFNGRCNLLVTDWDRDGAWDVLLGQHVRSGMAADVEFSLPRHRKTTVVYLRNIGTNEAPRMAEARLLTLADGTPLEFGTHSCAPSVYDVDGDGWDDLFVGAETGFVHYYHRSMLEDASRVIRVR